MRLIICAFLLPLLCLTEIEGMAHTVNSREAHAVVQSIDRPAHTLTLAYDQGHGPEKLLWNGDTQFVCGSKCASANDLKEGTPATIYYHSPLFGKPSATKVVWTNATAQLR